MQMLKVLLVAVVLVFSAVPFAVADDMAATTEQVSININDADIEALVTLKGIGEKKAQAIIAWREQHGTFESVEQLLEVKGIGESTLAQNQHRITLE